MQQQHLNHGGGLHRRAELRGRCAVFNVQARASGAGKVATAMKTLTSIKDVRQLNLNGLDSDSEELRDLQIRDVKVR